MGYFDGTVNLFDVRTGAKLRHLSSPLPAHPDNRVSVAMHPHKPWVAVGYVGADTILIRDLTDGTVVRTVHTPVNLAQVLWHPEGGLLAVSDFRGVDIHLFECPGFAEVRTLHGSGHDNNLAFHPGGHYLAAYSWERRLQLFELATGTLLLDAPAQLPMYYPRFSRDGRRLAADVVDGQLRIWQVADTRVYRTLVARRGTGGTTGTWAAIAPDNRLLAVQLDDDGVRFWDLATGYDLGRLPGRAHVMPLFVPGPHAALVTGGSPGVLRWPLVPSAEPGTVKIGPPQTLTSGLALATTHSRDGRLVTACTQPVSSETKSGGWLFDADRPGAPQRLLAGQNVMNIAISPDGHWLVTLLSPATDLKVWDASDRCLGEPCMRPHKELTARDGYHPRFSPDGRWLAYSGDPGGLYAVDTWQLGLRFTGRGQFSPDSRLLAVDTGKGAIRLIDVERGREVARLEDPSQQAAFYHLFSPDGTCLVTLGKGGEGGIHVWDLRLLRSHLKELDLDWDAPAYPPAATGRPALRLQLDSGPVP